MGRRRRPPDPRDLVYAEWRRHDDARTAREDELVAIVGAPAEAVQRHICEDGVEVARGDDGRPGAPQGLLGATCSTCHDTGIADGAWTSVKTGRTYEPRTAPSGLVFGWEHKTRYIMIEAGGYTVEKCARGNRQVDIFADDLSVKLKRRASVIDAVKEYVDRPEDREVLDALLQHWFRYPGTWKCSRKRINAKTKDIRFNTKDREGVLRIFNRPAFRDTWIVKQKRQ